MNLIIRFILVVLCVNIIPVSASFLENDNVKIALKEASYIKGAYEAEGILAIQESKIDINFPLLFMGINDVINQHPLIDEDSAIAILNNYSLKAKKLERPDNVSDEQLQSLFQALNTKIPLRTEDFDNALISYTMGIGYTNEVFRKYKYFWDLSGNDYCLQGTVSVNYNIDDILSGFKETLAKKGRYTTLEIRQKSNLYFTALTQARLEEDRLFYEKFLADPKTSKTATGLLYQLDSPSMNLNELTKIAPDDKVSVNFNGKLVNGCEIINTYNDEPKTFRMKDLIPGWQEALKLVNTGQKITIVVPPELGYGKYNFTSEDGNTYIDKDSLMIFEIELLDIIHH